MEKNRIINEEFFKSEKLFDKIGIMPKKEILNSDFRIKIKSKINTIRKIMDVFSDKSDEIVDTTYNRINTFASMFNSIITAVNVNKQDGSDSKCIFEPYHTFPYNMQYYIRGSGLEPFICFYMQDQFVRRYLIQKHLLKANKCLLVVSVSKQYIIISLFSVLAYENQKKVNGSLQNMFYYTTGNSKSGSIEEYFAKNDSYVREELLKSCGLSGIKIMEKVVKLIETCGTGFLFEFFSIQFDPSQYDNLKIPNNLNTFGYEFKHSFHFIHMRDLYLYLFNEEQIKQKIKASIRKYSKQNEKIFFLYNSKLICKLN